MSDTAVLVLLAMLAPVILVGVGANLVLWFGNRPLPYNEEYEHEQLRDRLYLERRRRQDAKQRA
jgi:hypothetical protein